MATFSANPHPSADNISGTLCSLFLSDGKADIKLTNLTEMIEVQPFFIKIAKKGSKDEN